MSTDYYKLKAPFSSVRVEETPGHDHVTFWDNGANCGTLVVTKGEGRAVVAAVTSEEVAVHCAYGGKGVGTVVEERVNGLTDDTFLVNGDNYDTIRVLQLRRKRGAGA